MRPKRCKGCGASFEPNSGRQERCDECRGRGRVTRARTPKRKRAREAAITSGSMKLRNRIRQIEQESFARFRAEKEAGG